MSSEYATERVRSKSGIQCPINDRDLITTRSAFHSRSHSWKIRKFAIGLISRPWLQPWTGNKTTVNDVVSRSILNGVYPDKQRKHRRDKRNRCDENRARNSAIGASVDESEIIFDEEEAAASEMNCKAECPDCKAAPAEAARTA